ncbi:unnamed protein product [Penicillium nalgiovense]|nr:unnamed protein product [Penicillium nalgiovense]
MPKNNVLRELLPRQKGSSMRYLETESPTKLRRVSLAYTDTTLYTKSYTAKLLNFRVALYRMVVKLRSRTPEEISRLIWGI